VRCGALGRLTRSQFASVFDRRLYDRLREEILGFRGLSPVLFPDIYDDITCCCNDMRGTNTSAMNLTSDGENRRLGVAGHHHPQTCAISSAWAQPRGGTDRCRSEQSSELSSENSSPRSYVRGMTSPRRNRRSSGSDADSAIEHASSPGSHAVFAEYCRKVPHCSTCDDSEEFDRAFEQSDIKGLVALLSSSQAIDSCGERLHSWALQPKTVGALAGTQLAILASTVDRDDSRIKDCMMKAGMIQHLVEYLKSMQEERVQIAMIALSILTTNHSASSQAVNEAGIMPFLLEHLKESYVEGMRGVAATTLRNICVDDNVCREKFVELGGIQGFVACLNPTPRVTPSGLDAQLDAVLNLQDILEDVDGPPGGLVARYAKLAIDAGAIPKLKEMRCSDDADVKCSVDEMLEALFELQDSSPSPDLGASTSPTTGCDSAAAEVWYNGAVEPTTSELLAFCNEVRPAASERQYRIISESIPEEEEEEEEEHSCVSLDSGSRSPTSSSNGGGPPADPPGGSYGRRSSGV